MDESDLQRDEVAIIKVFVKYIYIYIYIMDTSNAYLHNEFLILTFLLKFPALNSA